MRLARERDSKKEWFIATIMSPAVQGTMRIFFEEKRIDGRKQVASFLSCKVRPVDEERRNMCVLPALTPTKMYEFFFSNDRITPPPNAQTEEPERMPSKRGHSKVKSN